MKWYKGDKELSRSEYNITNADGVVTMEIGSCQPEDSGKYRCVATNALGEAETNCVIIVEGMSPGDELGKSMGTCGLRSAFFRDRVKMFWWRI